MATAVERLIDLLNYIQEVEKLKVKPVFTVSDQYFRAFAHELAGLPAVRFNLQSGGDDVWLRIQRIAENPPPSPSKVLAPWVAISKGVDNRPELKTEIVIAENAKEVVHKKIADCPEVTAEFNSYVQNFWEPWSVSERPRRNTISIYNKLFALQQTISSEGVETPLELIWGMGFACWKKPSHATALRYPLLLQSCEVSLNERSFEIEVRPREIDTSLEIDCFAEMGVAGVVQLEEFWKSFQQTGAARVNPFDASSFDGVLRAAVTYLDSTGSYDVKAEASLPPAPAESLQISNSWVLFARRRTGDMLRLDVERMKTAVNDARELPPIIRSFVETGEESVQVHEEISFRGLETSDAHPGMAELYFPMPYNDEQVQIIKKLESNDGVVVQGPPGTGKTHTIANVICHYLANGKRVLVSSRGETALAVLREKLPERIRPLSVALMSEDRDGMKQFEHAIQTIASQVSALNPTRLVSEIQRHAGELDRLHARIANLDQNISAHARNQMKNYNFRGAEISTEEMARRVIEEADEHDWLNDDLPEPSKDGIGFNIDDIAALRNARAAVADDLSYLSAIVPTSDDLPDTATLLDLHRSLLRSREIEADLKKGATFSLVDTSIETQSNAKSLAKFFDDYSALKKKIASSAATNKLFLRFATLNASDTLLVTLLDVCRGLRKLEERRKVIVGKAIEIPDRAENNSDLDGAIARLCEGKRAFALPLGNAEARGLIASVRVQGRQPEAGNWPDINSVIQWRRDACREISQWKALAREFALSLPGAISPEAAVRELQAQVAQVETARQFSFDFERQLSLRIEKVFGTRVAIMATEKNAEHFSEVRSSLVAHLDHERLGYEKGRLHELLHNLDGRSGAIVGKLRNFLLLRLGRIEDDEGSIASSWGEFKATLLRLNGLRSSFETILRVTDAIQTAGAPKWSERLRTEPRDGEYDALLPERWLEAWNWRLAANFLDRIDAHAKIRSLFDERRALTASLSRTYQDLVADKTWHGVYINSPVKIRQALQKYLNAMQAMGTGTGIRSIRHRRDARAAMREAYLAVPCWILPQWRVAETIPAQLGLFDLVVIDEASQSDIWALPILLRGKKLLIVGDHMQVSPAAVGMAEQKIVDLARRFLDRQPHGAQMTPDKSIYDLARVVCAGNSVMLREHFRCVPALIEFSKRHFYSHKITPLRVPTATERLDPPLIDVFVKGGYREGNVNPAEALAIAQEIEQLVADDRYSGRSIGVVTLLGNDQAQKIQALVSERISPEHMVAHHIAIGPPPVFQGRERDIMLVSMVLVAGNNAAASAATQEQRFNVALSRARDRMYLFRSVEHNAFADDTLSGKVLQHFRQPFAQDERDIAKMRTQCESPFEIALFDELVAHQFRVAPQVGTMGYRIDLVIEGTEGRRLAIECDGDRFHGPGQWSDDMARQRVLERAGWTFWRCFASSFVRRRKEVLDDLWKTLAELGISPLGQAQIDASAFVHSRVVDPFDVESKEQASST